MTKFARELCVRLMYCSVVMALALGTTIGHAEERQVGDNEKMSYRLYGAEDQAQPEDGWRLLLILPGGDGSADFAPFCENIQKNALPPGYLVAQLVAPVWSEQQQVVWPIKKLNPAKAKFTTEEFIAAVVEDVGKDHELDERYVFTLGWSSGGPPVYAAALTENSPVTGSFVAMSVFKKNLLPDLENGEDHAFYLLHSPQDWIKIDQHARVALDRLENAGAAITLQTYQGGHGWREDPFGHIRKGIEWLEERQSR